MAAVTGRYVMSDDAPLPAGVQPRVEAIPSENTVTSLGRVMSVYPQTKTPSPETGGFTFELTPTDLSFDRDFHYLIRGYHLVPNGYGSTGYSRVDVFERKIYVPSEGGNIGDLAFVKTESGYAWQGSTPPPHSGLWLYVEPGFDPAGGAPLPVYTAPDGTTVEHGELVEWST